MHKHPIRRGAAALLAALTLVQGAALSSLAAQVEQADGIAALSQTKEVEPQLQNGSAVIPAGSSPEQVKEILAEALVANAQELDAQSLEWEYYCTGKNGLLTNDAWGSVNGFTSEKKVVFVPTTFTHPALADNEDRDYQVRLAGTETAVTLTKLAKQPASIVLQDGCTVSLPYREDVSVDYDALGRAIFAAAVQEITPELQAEDVSIEYYATATTGSVGDLGKAWMPLEGGKKDGLPYPAISAGTQRIRISWAGNDTYYSCSAETTVMIAERSEAPYVLQDPVGSVTLALREDLTVDYDALRTQIFHAVIASSEVLTPENVTIQYYYRGITDLDSKWLPLEGETLVGSLSYPAISAGEQKIRITWSGNQTYAPTAIESTVTVRDREEIQFQLREGPYSVGMVFDDAQGYDYEATAAAIFEAVVAGTQPVQLTADDVTVEYNASLLPEVYEDFQPLDASGLTNLKKFGTGAWQIRISWAGNREYRGGSVVVEVETTDSRLESRVALKTGVSFSYDMDPAVMKQAIFDNVIDWENAQLPEKETLSLEDFTLEYYSEAVLLDGGIQSGIRNWAPVEGKVYAVGGVTLGSYPQMGAGEQQIRISYRGSADYRPSDSAEGTVSVAKAKVQVRVHSDNIFADEALPEGFITTSPADRFDFYTIYAGVTSNVTTGVYLDLPDRYTDSAVIRLLDPIVEKIWGKSFTQMLNDGVTVGELRELLSTQELLDLLETLNIDTGTFGEILRVVGNLPSIVDGVRVSFGTPNRAGLYTVAVVTDNENYETGVGMGFLLVKMRLSGVQLTWNQELSSISAAEAEEFDFGATLSYDGDVSISQESVHYLYTGLTSSWRLYSSTTTPPTEPGSYVVTVVTLGGNYQAAPITRSFRITK